MRKRRRLANKLTIFVCAVLCAVSAFFYVPMDVYAQNARTEINDDLIFSSETVTFWHDDFLNPDPNSIQGNGVAQSVYYETIIPIPMKQIFYPDGSSNIDCSGNIFEFNVTGGFTIEPYILTGNSSNNIRSVSVSKATLVFDSQEQPLSTNPTWTRAFFNSSKFVDKEISGFLYIKVGVVYSVESSSVELKGSYDKVCIRAILKSGQTAWINFYNDNGNVTSGDLSQQTDNLTNGYDDSKGNEVNSELSTGLNEYQTAEDSLWATATTGLKDFTFFDFESVPAMITGMSFITSIIGKWFNEAGGTSGVGIVLSILFSVMLVSMVLGLYRLYQSAGHRAEARQRYAERMQHWKKGK